MATEKKRQEFIARFVAEYSGTPSSAAKFPGWEKSTRTAVDCLTGARALLRYARTHGRLAVEECNGPGDYIASHATSAPNMLADWEAGLAKRRERCEARIREICAQFNLPVTLGGDPRGYTVKVRLPSGAYNTWGGSWDEYGVPQ